MAACLAAWGLCAAENPAPQKDAVVVKLNPLGLATDDLLVGGESRRTASLRLNTELVRRVVLDANDVQEATLNLSCRRVGLRIGTLARGSALNGQSVTLTDEQSLKGFRLAAGEEIVISVYKGDWHFNGGATLAGLKIRRLDAPQQGQHTALPETFADGTAKTDLGTFVLVGLYNRDRFPTCKKRSAVKAGEKPGQFLVPEGHGATLTLRNGDLSLHTNGRANWEAKYGWAPALVFAAAKDGTYALEGQLSFRCARPEGKVAWIVGRLLKPGGPLNGTALSLHRLLRPPAEPAVAGVDYDATPVARVVLSRPGGETVAITDGLAPLLRDCLSGHAEDRGLLLVADKADGAPADVLVQKGLKGSATVKSHPKHLLFDHEIKPQPGVYASMKGGKLYYGDRRLRLWSMVKDGPAERVRRLGFNCLRAWFQSDLYTAESAKKGEAATCVKGDGSKLDLYDKMIADMKKNGVFIMFATTIGQGMPMKPVLEDGSWLHAEHGGDRDWAEWKEAVRKAGGQCYQLGFVDDRLWEIRIRHARNVLNHVNPYTGKRYAEEEAIALIEINNESAMAYRWLSDGFEKWPPYFRRSLQRQWNAWLAKRYGTDEKLLAAWARLGDGETLAGGTIQPAPVLAQHRDYPRARQMDFVRFIYETIDARNQDYVRFCRSLAPKGVGVNVVPFSFDSQYRPSIPWLYTNWLGDTSTVSMYFWGNGTMLSSPPGLYVLDSHRLQDKLSVVYETQRGRPSRYRTEYPYMLSVLTSWQDFDIVNWHGAWIGEQSDEQLLAGRADPPATSHYWTAVHLETDPVMSSAIAMAGRIFLSGAIETAPNPVTYTVGKQGIFSYDLWNGIGGREMSFNTFTRGSRVVLKPEEDCGLLVDGKPLEKTPAATEAIATGQNVLWDWPNRRLIIDAPTAKAYIGKTVRSHRFKDGITLSGFNTPFVSFALISADGKPLLGENACRKAYVSAVFDAKNTGFGFDYAAPGGPAQQAKAVRDRGHAPVIVDKVSYTLSFPQAIDGRFVGYDFAMRQQSAADIRNQNTLRRPEQTDWMGVLEIAGRGDPAEPVQDPSPGAAVAEKGATTQEPETTDRRLADIPNPLPDLSWGDDYLFLKEHHQIVEPR